MTGIILAVFARWRSLAVFTASPGSCRGCPVDGDNLGTDQPGDLRNEYRATSPRHLVYF
ncbi:hypothetical protein ACVXHB_23090 [Escherichia coli]